MSEQKSLKERLEEVVADITLADNMAVDVVYDEEADDGRYYVQIACWRKDVITGVMGMGYGGRVAISPLATRDSMVKSIFAAYLAYVEHEARENFQWRGRRVFGPHIKLDALYQVARRVDIPDAQHLADRPDDLHITPLTDEHVLNGGSLQ